MEKKFNLIITTPEGSFFKEDVSLFVVKAYGGYIGILPEHTPFVSTIKPCKFEIKENNTSQPISGFIADGVISVDKKAVKVIATKVEWEREVKKDEAKDNILLVEENIKKETKPTKLKNLKNLKEYYELILKGNS